MTHLKKKLSTDILATLRQFNAGESEMIPYEDSHTDTRTWDARCRTLRNQGVLEGKFKFSAIQTPRATLICRIS